MNSTRRCAAFAALILAFVALPSSAQSSAPVIYGLGSASTYTEGCYPPCLCPIWFGGTPTGTLRLQFTATDPAGFDHYVVQSVAWTMDTFGVTHVVTGTGQYKRGGQVVVQEQLTLDLSVDGAPTEHYDSGLVPPAATFPRIEIAISLNGMYCYDKVFSLDAAPIEAGVAYCFGDGSGTACPCANSGAPGNGCASSVNAAGANLIGTGSASLSADGVVLVSSGTPSAPAFFFQGTQRTNGGAGVVFGDGLLCAGGIATRLKLTQAVMGEARLPGPLDPPLSILGGIAAPGVYVYQCWYRESPPFCTPATYNLTNGYEITWTP
ncbi:MAG: hypothetical protein JNL28_16245 [Planctomycetes bacterium]|nr:hypothetical protein [Planctomycetota bacterium]